MEWGGTDCELSFFSSKKPSTGPRQHLIMSNESTAWIRSLDPHPFHLLTVPVCSEVTRRKPEVCIHTAFNFALQMSLMFTHALANIQNRNYLQGWGGTTSILHGSPWFKYHTLCLSEGMIWVWGFTSCANTVFCFSSC